MMELLLLYWLNLRKNCCLVKMSPKFYVLFVVYSLESTKFDPKSDSWIDSQDETRVHIQVRRFILLVVYVLIENIDLFNTLTFI